VLAKFSSREPRLGSSEVELEYASSWLPYEGDDNGLLGLVRELEDPP